MCKLDGLEMCRDDTPVRSEIGIYLVIFIWELNVMFLDVSPLVFKLAQTSV